MAFLGHWGTHVIINAHFLAPLHQKARNVYPASGDLDMAVNDELPGDRNSDTMTRDMIVRFMNDLSSF